MPVPGCPRGYIGPGGLADYSAHPNCTGTLICAVSSDLIISAGGAAGYIDKMVFGENHMYQNPTCKEMYQTGGVCN